MPKIVVRYTKFSSNQFGDGGAKRSAQIKEFWTKDDIEFIDEKFVLPKKYSKNKAIRWVVRSFVFISKYVGWSNYKSIRKKINAVLLFALRIPIVYDKYNDKNVIFVWEYTQDYAPMYLMKAAGAKIIAYPHNLESLVPTQMYLQGSNRHSYWLYEEVERLKMCDEVYCISKEETWLLSLFGVNAFYYPYYPPKEVEKALIEIKEERKHKQPLNNPTYLVLGSATNPPTRLGMEDLIKVLDSDNMKYTLHVAGYGSECLNKVANDNIIYDGTLCADDLHLLLSRIDGLIIYQPPTTGALTRIAEMRVADIPVFVDFSSARDYYNLDGVIVYNSFNQLKNLLNSKI